MEDKDLLNVVEVIFARAQKSGIIELNEAPALLSGIEALKAKIKAVEDLQKELTDLKQLKEKKELKALKE